MGERPDEDGHDDGSDDGSDDETSDAGTINDPLTRTDVEAPQKPFGSGPESSD